VRPQPRTIAQGVRRQRPDGAARFQADRQISLKCELRCLR
jgi:hypothetical protein